MSDTKSDAWREAEEMFLDTPSGDQIIGKIASLIGERDAASAAGERAGREAAERECIRLICSTCKLGHMPFLAHSNSWWHGKSYCRAGWIYVHIRQREDADAGPFATDSGLYED